MLNDFQEAGTAFPSMVSGALLHISMKAKGECEAALLEKAIKEAATTGCIGSCLAFIVCLFDVYFILSVSSRFGYRLFKCYLILFLADERCRRRRPYMSSCLLWSSILTFKLMLKKRLTLSWEKISEGCRTGMTAFLYPTLMPL
jgi:hypothetical protein